MVALEVGRVCIKTTGREAGHYCVVLKKTTDEKSKDSFVLITGPKLLTGVKRRKCNVEHLEPTQYTLEIKEDANDEEVIAVFEKAGLVAKFGLKKPSAAEMKGKKEEKVEVRPKKAKTKKEEKKKK